MKKSTELIKSMFIGIIIGLIILQFCRICIVQGKSMEPTLQDKNIVILNRVSYKLNEPQCGDIIAFKYTNNFNNKESKFLIKRVIATSGQHVLIENGNVFIDGQLKSENYIEGNTVGEVDMVVPQGKVFVMGDNRKNSLDSRDKRVGMVSVEDILGKIMFKN